MLWKGSDWGSCEPAARKALRQSKAVKLARLLQGIENRGNCRTERMMEETIQE